MCVWFHIYIYICTYMYIHYNMLLSDYNLFFEKLSCCRLGEGELWQYPNPHYPTPYAIMARNSSFNIGRFTDFVELHLSLFSRPYFACLQDSLDNNSYDMNRAQSQLLQAIKQTSHSKHVPAIFNHSNHLY